MEKYIESLLKVITHFRTHNSPSPRHVGKFRSSIGLFPEIGRESDDTSSTRSKRKGACVFLTKVHEDLGFRMALLCAFTFAPTTLYEIGQLSSFIDEMKDKITGPLQVVAVNFGANIESYKIDLEAKFNANAISGQEQGRTKRRMSDTTAHSQATAQKIRRVTSPREEVFSAAGTTEPSTGPPVSNAPLKGKVYNISVETTFRLLALTRRSDLQQSLTVPDSEQWPFITFRCSPREVIKYLTESDQVMSLA
ncbi:hypothetical protein CABS02_14333 [Colletotrichum abscissum]|uniref:Uncharacterized protein n=1 Tax=Colletotrichum abscissum TaxID=1671311 RepID=A0A9P9X138_9PEZI|nr:hypothetical protein CABS02_14333 [Colletotrichum abscissum]